MLCQNSFVNTFPYNENVEESDLDFEVVTL